MQWLALTHPTKFRLRTVNASDTVFLQTLYAETRQDLQALPVPEAMIEQLITLQYQAQLTSYQAQFPHAEHLIIEKHNQPCGRLMVDQEEKALRVVDIALLTAMRNQGIGTCIFEFLQQFVQANQQVLRLTMKPNDQALCRFYRRLGFQHEAQGNGLYQVLYYLPLGKTTMPFFPKTEQSSLT